MLMLGDFQYDPTTGELEAGGHRTRLEPRAAEVLNLLIDHQGEVISRAALLEQIWGNRIVVDEVITRCIHMLRRALQDETPYRAIETLPKRGYRLNVPVAAAPRNQPLERASVVTAGTPREL